MARYKVTFNIEAIVNMPGVNEGSENEIVYNENGTQTISDDLWNDIVSKAVDSVEDAGSCVTEITREPDDCDDYDDCEEE